MKKKLFKLLHWQHFKIKAHNGKPYIKEIVRIINWRAAIIDQYDGQRIRTVFMFKIFKWYL